MDADRPPTFGGYALDLANERLLHEGEGMPLAPKGFAVLRRLVGDGDHELSAPKGLQHCKPGEGGGKLIGGDQVRYGGTWVVNPSWGHPFGATGLGQCAELVWQLHGMTEKRRVEGALIALRHNVGLGGACVVTMDAESGGRSLRSRARTPNIRPSAPRR
jgi:Thiolase C-terminal domain-like